MAIRHYRRVIKIKAEDSPNVKLALKQQELGLSVTDDIVIPGVLTWGEYQKRRQTWDKIRQCIGLDAEFYEGSEILCYPPIWLNRAEEIAKKMTKVNHTLPMYMGIDPAEGGDSSCWCVGNKQRIWELLSLKTPDTTFITSRTLALAAKWKVLPQNCHIDTGGGGKQHADRLREEGFPITAVGFGESVAQEIKWGKIIPEERVETKESRYVYKNRRAQMAGMSRDLIDPTNDGFGIPEEYHELRRQMAPIPLTYDAEGRFYLLPKRTDPRYPDRPSLEKLLGCSPDEMDSFFLMVYGMMKEDTQTTISIL